MSDPNLGILAELVRDNVALQEPVLTMLREMSEQNVAMVQSLSTSIQPLVTGIIRDAKSLQSLFSSSVLGGIVESAERSMQVVRNSFNAFAQTLPENLRADVSLSAMLKVAEGLGIPIAWVIPADILHEVAKCDDIGTAHLILMDSKESILECCRNAITDIGNEQALEGEEVISLMALGRWRIAQSHSTTVFESLLHRTGWEGPNRVRSKKQLKFEGERDWKTLEWEEVPRFYALRPMAVARFKVARIADIPINYNRHATTHWAFDGAVSEDRALVATMLYCSLVRLLHEKPNTFN